MNASEPRRGFSKQLGDQIPLITKVALFLIIVVTLHLVGATIGTTVIIAALVAVFGPGLLPWESILITARSSKAEPEPGSTAVPPVFPASVVSAPESPAAETTAPRSAPLRRSG